MAKMQQCSLFQCNNAAHFNATMQFVSLHVHLMQIVPSVQHRTLTFTKMAHHTSVRLYSVQLSYECRTCAL